MSNILTIAYITEGTTDKRFLGNIIKRTFVEDLAPSCFGQIDVYDPQFFEIREKAFVNKSLEAARLAKWLDVLCIHTDADATTDDMAYNDRILPAIKKINEREEKLCKNIITIVPVRMTEAWMLADLDLLVDEIGTKKTKEELQLPIKVKQVEDLVDPKKTIANAIDIAFADQPARRRRGVTISEIYSPLSQNCARKTPSPTILSKI
jgi:hypothetical protein